MKNKMRIEHMPKASGVYQITTPNGDYYIGKSENMYRRMLAHMNDAKQKVHYNPRLKNAFAKYGSKMTCKVLALASKDDISYLETYYINLFFGDRRCMNMALDPVGCDKTKNRNGYTPGYFVAYWTRTVLAVDSMGEWAKALGKSHAWRGMKNPTAKSKCAMFPTQQECEDWLNRMDKLVTLRIVKKLTPKNKTSMQLKRERNQRLKWLYQYAHHIKCPDGRATLAKNTFEMRRYSMLDGYSRRRFGQSWHSYKAPSGKIVFGKNEIGLEKTWDSVGLCARELSLSHVTVLKHARGERSKTHNGWKLWFSKTELKA
jgi:group I intron endonuclease